LCGGRDPLASGRTLGAVGRVWRGEGQNVGLPWKATGQRPDKHRGRSEDGQLAEAQPRRNEKRSRSKLAVLTERGERGKGEGKREKEKKALRGTWSRRSGEGAVARVRWKTWEGVGVRPWYCRRAGRAALAR
jgi:hypothetical protein